MINANEPRRPREPYPASAGSNLRRTAHRRVLRLVAVAVGCGLGGATGCGGYAITATDGAVFAASGDARQQLASALTRQRLA